MRKRYNGFRFNVPETILFMGPKFHLDTTYGSEIEKKVVLFFKNYRYKEFNPAETSEILEFW